LKIAMPISAASVAAGSGDATGAQGARDRGSQRGQLDQLPLLELGVPHDQRMARAREVDVAAVFEVRTRRFDRSRDRSERAGVASRAGDAVDDPPLRVRRTFRASRRDGRDGRRASRRTSLASRSCASACRLLCWLHSPAAALDPRRLRSGQRLDLRRPIRDELLS
jgi:hypothetical protein